MSDVRQAIYRFTPQGHQDVERAIGSVSRAYVRAAADQRIAARKAAQTQRETTNEAVRLERERLKSTERAAKDRMRAEERAAKDQQRTVARSEREKAATERREQIVARRQADALSRAKAREADKWNRDRQRLVDRTLREETQATERAARKQAQISAQAERQKQRELDKSVRKRQREFESRQDSIQLSGLGRGALGGIAGIGLALGGAAIGAVGSVINSSLREQVSLQALARDVSISSRDPGEKGADINALQKSWNETAMRTPGQTAEGVGGAVKAYVSKTGDLDMARQLQNTFAQVASATGADIKEIGSAAAELSTKFDVKTVEDMQAAFASMAFQGKKGAFELRDAAGEFARMGSAAQRYGMEKGSRGVKTLGGFAQLAMGATGNAAMASTAVDAMLSKLQTQSGIIKTASGGKAKVYEGTGKTKKTRDARDVVAEAVTYIGGNDVEKKNAKLKEIFDTDGLKALSPLIQEFSRALAAGEEPLKAVRAKIEDAAEAGARWSEVMTDAAAAQAATSAKFEAVWQSLGMRVGERLLPVASELAEKFLVNDKALDTLVVSVVACGEALGVLVDFLKTIPAVRQYFEKKKTTKEAKEDLARYDEIHAPKEKKHNGIGPGVEEIDPKRQKLVQALEEAESFDRDLQDEMRGVGGAKGHEERMKKYGTGEKSAGQLAFETASNPASQVLGPGGQMVAAGVAALFGGVNTAQQDRLVQARAGVEQYEKVNKVDTKAAEEALHRAAQEIERAARTHGGRGDPFGGVGGKL